MNPFTYVRAADETEAVQRGHDSGAKYLGGGTNLVDLMRETIERPEKLVDITGLPREIEERPDGSVWIGAAARNTQVVEHRAIRSRFPVLARAILAGASAQIRNMATVGGNLLQRTRCTYFYDTAARCNKRQRGAGCDAQEGFHRTHAILGTSSHCIATHPSDMCVALVALDAIVHLRSLQGTRAVALTDLHVTPGERPDIETVMQPGELILGVELPPPGAMRATYRKVRDRASYAFALVSVAALLETEGGRVKDLRLAFGGVGTVPWRARVAEDALRGNSLDEERIRSAIDTELAPATTRPQNVFKRELLARTVIAVLGDLAGGAA